MFCHSLPLSSLSSSSSCNSSWNIPESNWSKFPKSYLSLSLSLFFSCMHTHTGGKRQVWRGDCWSKGSVYERVFECWCLFHYCFVPHFQTLIALRGQFAFHSLSQQVGELGVGDGVEGKWCFKEEARGERLHRAKRDCVAASVTEKLESQKQRRSFGCIFVSLSHCVFLWMRLCVAYSL